MFNINQNFATAQQINLDTLSTLSQSALGCAERLVSLNLNTGRAVLEDSVGGVQAVLNAKTPQELLDAQAALMQPSVEVAVAFGRSLYELAIEAQQEAAKLVEGQFAELNQTVTSALEQAAQSAPAGSEAVFAAVKSALDSGNIAYENVSKTTRQIADAAASHVATLTEATVRAVKSAGARQAA